MTEVMVLIADLRARGVELEPRGDKLHLTAPTGTLTPDVLAMIAEHKPEVMAALREHERCCPACGRRAGPPLRIDDGCQLHNVSADQVAAWWKVAQERDAHVSVCHCCAGPAPSAALVCRRCEEAS